MHCDLLHPGTKLVGVAEMLEVAQGVKERVLHHIFGLGNSPEQTRYPQHHPPDMTLVQGVLRKPIPVQGARHQLAIPNRGRDPRPERHHRRYHRGKTEPKRSDQEEFGPMA
jgi:hypothetical protein